MAGLHLIEAEEMLSTMVNAASSMRGTSSTRSFLQTLNRKLHRTAGLQSTVVRLKEAQKRAARDARTATRV